MVSALTTLMPEMVSSNTAYKSVMPAKARRLARLRSLVSRRIKKALSKEPVLHHYLEPAMLGGLKLRIGDQLIDGSVATKLKRLKHNLTISGPTKMRTRMDRIIEEGEA